MNDELDRRVASARASLDVALDQIEIPEPTSRSTRLWAPLAAAALVGVLAIGALVANRTTDNGDVLQPADASDTTAAPIIDPIATPSPTTSSPSTTSVETPEPQSPRRVTSAGPDIIIAPVASSTQAFNSTGSLALLYRTGPTDIGHVVFDTTTWTEVAVLDLSAATDIEDIVWSTDDPDLVHYIDPTSMTIVNLDIRSGASTVGHRFDGCDAVDFGDTSGSSNSGSSLIAANCRSADGDQWVAVNLSTGNEVARVAATTESAPIAMQSGNGFVVVTDDRVEVLDSELRTTGVSIDATISAYALAIVEDRDVLAATVFDGNAIGTVVSFDLVSGEARVVIGPETGWQYPPTGTNLSTAVGNRIAIATSPQLGDTEPDRLDDIIAVVDLSTGELTAITDHAMADGDRFGNWSQPYVSLGPDGATVLFGTDQGGDRVDTYVAAL